MAIEFPSGPTVGPGQEGVRDALISRSAPLPEREALLQAILETSPDGLITIDQHGVIQSFNPAAERVFGYAAAEVIGRNVSCLMAARYREKHDACLERFLRTGEKRIIGIAREVLGQRKDGTIFPLELAVGEVEAAAAGSARVGRLRGQRGVHQITAPSAAGMSSIKICLTSSSPSGPRISADFPRELVLAGPGASRS